MKKPLTVTNVLLGPNHIGVRPSRKCKPETMRDLLAFLTYDFRNYPDITILTIGVSQTIANNKLEDWFNEGRDL